jgi:serine protease Do
MKHLSLIATFISISTLIVHTAHARECPVETDDAFLRDLILQSKEHETHRQPWRPVQEEVRDTVVQIFAQIAEVDLLQPYKTPSQYGVRGSGFFINERGDIITNAHVVDQACALWIQVPSLGKYFIDVDLIGICPERDLALLRVSEQGIAFLRAQLGFIPHLPLGDSDTVYRADEVLALGYPLGQESLKSTTGVISGREKNFIQMSAPINQGSSGGPLLNVRGEVIGINTAGVTEAQNIGYIIPVNDLRVILPDLYKTKLLRKPYMGVMLMHATESLVTYLGNPLPGGAYVVEVVPDSPLHKAGLQQGDMIYTINGYPVDMYGEMKVPWAEDKISISNYVSRLAIGERVELVLYRSGERHALTVIFDYSELLPIRRVYPGYEELAYDVFGGMVVMELTVNHIKHLISQAPGLARYADVKQQTEPQLVITHIFPNSQLFKSRTLQVGMTIHEINGIAVGTIASFKQALQANVGANYLIIKACDTVTKSSDNVLVVLPMAKLLEEERVLSQAFHYPLSEVVKS